jgi:16S rRNA (cytosine967-C5)-methyltransferase
MNARAIAVRVLERVELSDAFLNSALDAEIKRARGLDRRDAAFATELCYGAARRSMALDYGISRLSARPLDRVDPRVRCALRVGAYQIFFMRLPRRAAVSETVEALKQLGMGRATGFANALLRKLSRMDELPLPPISDPLAHLAVRESHPAWLLDRWSRRYGRARAEEMAMANNRPAPLTVRANSTRVKRTLLLERFAQSGVRARATEVSPVGVALEAPGRVQDIDGYSEGLWQVQDEAAQLVGLYCGIEAGMRVLDVCAAPGGKACHLAEQDRVVAADISRTKLRKVEAEAQRLGLRERIEVLEHDATKPFPSQLCLFEAVLVDAPCSGLGTLHRHPELRHRRREEDIARLAKLQNQILENCHAVVAPGGVLIYVVCSTEPEEGQQQIEEFRAAHAGWLVEPPRSEAKLPLEDGYLRTLPGEQGWDGFFAARLRRVG